MVYQLADNTELLLTGNPKSPTKDQRSVGRTLVDQLGVGWHRLNWLAGSAVLGWAQSHFLGWLEPG